PTPSPWGAEPRLPPRERAPAGGRLRLEQDRNRALPPLRPVASAAEHTRRFNAAITEYVAYLRDNKILTLRDWMEPALRARIGHFTRGEKREFFTEVDFRDPVMMRTHGYHWIDLAWME